MTVYAQLAYDSVKVAIRNYKANLLVFKSQGCFAVSLSFSVMSSLSLEKLLQ